MKHYIKDEISRLRTTADKLEQLLDAIDEDNDDEKIELIIQCKEDTLIKSRLDKYKRETIVKVLSSYTRDYLFDKRRIPPKLRLGIKFNTLRDTFCGQWFTRRYYSHEEPSDDFLERGVIREFTDLDGFKYDIKVAVVIVGYYYNNHMRHPGVHIRYLDHTGKYQDWYTDCLMNLTPITHPQLIKYVFRHQFNKIRKHIRRWVEHIRYKPGGVGFKRSRESFEQLTGKK